MKLNKKSLSVILAVCLITTLFTSCNSQKEIKVLADEKILEHFSDFLSPEDILDLVSEVNFYYEMDNKGLKSEAKEVDTQDERMIYYSDKDGNVIYEVIEGFEDQGFFYHTKDKEGNPIKVEYCYGSYYDNNEDGHIRDICITADNYSINFNRTNDDSPYRADVISAMAIGNENDLIHESISYLYENGRWTASANYFADDGLHHYSRYYESDDKYEDTDSILFEKKDNVKAIDIKSMIEYFGDDNYTLEIEISSVPFYSIEGNKTKWYFTGGLAFIFLSTDDAEKFAKEFDGQVMSYGDFDAVHIKNTGIPIADDAEFFDPYKYSGKDETYYNTPHFNENYELTDLTEGTIVYY